MSYPTLQEITVEHDRFTQRRHREQNEQINIRVIVAQTRISCNSDLAVQFDEISIVQVDLKG